MYAIYQEWHIEDEDDGAEITSYVSDLETAKAESLDIAEGNRNEFSAYEPGSWWRVDLFEVEDELDLEDHGPDSIPAILHIDGTN